MPENGCANDFKDDNSTQEIMFHTDTKGNP